MLEWEGHVCLVWKIPYSNIEVLSFVNDDHLVGITYNPLFAVSPRPWSSKCAHCHEVLSQYGSSKDPLNTLSVRQALRILYSTRLDPPSSYNWILSARHRAHGEIAVRNSKITIIQDKDFTFEVTKKTTEKPIYNGSWKDFRSRHVQKGLKLLLSARIPDDNEIMACLNGLKLALPPDPILDCWKQIPIYS